MSSILQIQNLHVSADGKEIVRGVSMEISVGSVQALLGPNGSGKSTLVNAIMGHPRYTITKGAIVLDGEDITYLKPEEKAKRGLFLSFQNPPEIEGVALSNMMRNAYRALHGTEMPFAEFQEHINAELKALNLEDGFARRHINQGFSGGEKKKSEILQLGILRPRFAFLDETDSGLDVDAIQTIAKGIMRFKDSMGILLITHYERILAYLPPEKVYVMSEGRIVKEGGREVAEEIEKNGYKNL